MELKNTFLISTDDNNIEKVLYEFIEKHCKENKVNVAIYVLSNEFGEEVKEMMFK